MLTFAPTLVGDYEHIYSKDPAIDTVIPTFDHLQWVRTGEAQYLPIKAGQLPCRIKLRHLGSRARAALIDAAQHGTASMAWLSVAYSVVGVDGLTLTWTTDDHGIKALGEESMDALGGIDGGALLGELSRRVLEDLFPSPL